MSFRTKSWILLLTALAGGCGDFTDVVRFQQQDDVSDCGGFQNGRSPLYDDPRAYCDAEVLEWSYDPAKEELKLLDARILLNCCGEHSMDIGYKNGVYHVTEFDRPLEGGGRCNCVCVFDYTLSAVGIPNEEIVVRIDRVIGDSGGDPYLVYEGVLDLTAGSGLVVIDPEPIEIGLCGSLP